MFNTIENQSEVQAEQCPLDSAWEAVANWNKDILRKVVREKSDWSAVVGEAVKTGNGLCLFAGVQLEWQERVDCRMEPGVRGRIL
jgi:hypothetical protein